MKELADRLAQGRAPETLRPWICGASLAALPKPDETHRPIAAGDTWRRITAKVLAKSHVDEFREYLEPVQLGVGTKMGCEAIVHICRQWFSRNVSATSKVLVTLDLSNAFNAIDRSAVLEAVRTVAPDLAPWCDFCYRDHAHLVIGDKLLSSARGVQQGDPLGPALFALAIHPKILKAKRRVESEFPGGLDFSVFYLDDGVIAGSDAAVARFCDLLANGLRDIGLEFTRSKCEVIPAAHFTSLAQRALFDGFKWVTDGDFKLLGAPIGGIRYCTEHTRKRKADAEGLMGEIRKMENTQSALLLTRHCAGFAKLVYSMRTVPPKMHLPALREFSGDLRETVEQILGEELPDRSWTLAQIGILHGGLGIRAPDQHAAAAYLASVSASQELCERIDPGFDVADSAGGLALAETNQLLDASILEAARSTRHDAVSKPSQKRMSNLVDAASKVRLRLNEAHDRSFLGHIALTSLPGAGVWLVAPPVDEDRKMDAILFRTALKRRIRMPIFEHDFACPCCGGCMDRFGDHALVCACKGDRTVRHNAIRNIAYGEAAVAGLRPEREKSGLLPGRPCEDGLPAESSLRRPADVWLPRGQRHKGEALDFACSSAMRSDYLQNVPDDPTRIFEQYEALKRTHNQTDQDCEAAGFDFTPMVVEAHSGAWSTTAKRVWDMIAKAQSASWNEDGDVSSLRIAQRLSIALHRENARAVLRRVPPEEETPSSPSAWHEMRDEAPM